MMKVNRVLFLLFVMITVFCCRKSYQPAEIIVNYGYLVVEGVINTGTNAITIINLTRTKNLGDTSRKTNAELRAKITIEADGGATYTLLETGNGAYQSAALNLNATLKYRLRIVTNNGSTYLSDLVQAKQTPAIDSVTWKQDKGVTVSVHTHDPQNKTIYYRWEFDETWQYRSFQQASLGVKNGLIFYRDSITQAYNCWGTEHSTNILTASSAVLAKDVISYAPLKFLPDSAEKIGIRYSINVLQYALSEEAYSYWEILKKNTQQTGTIFDPQPSQQNGNIKCLTNPNEPVLGFVTACSIAEKRIFIDNGQLTNWVYINPANNFCVQVNGLQDGVNYLRFIYPDTTFSPYYFISGGGIALLKAPCLDCTRRGGTNVKPSFWK